MKVEGFQDHERKKGDEGVPNIGLEPGGKEVPGKGDLGYPDAPHSGELVGQRNGKSKRKDFLGPQWKRVRGQ